MSNQLAKLLEIIGRQLEEPATICTKTADGPMSVEWTTVGDAPGVAEKYSGQTSVWFGVQPVRVSSGRGKANDVTALVTLYADLDDKNMSRSDAMSVIGDLADVLGVGPSALVLSGGGLQPFWPVEPMDPASGAQLLLWWREQVIRVTSARGLSVDTGVYDLARILRCPGPPNMKPEYGPGGARTGLVVPSGGRRLSVMEIREAIERAPVKENVTRVSRSGVSVTQRTGVGSDDRVFTPEQAKVYLARPDGPVAVAKDTPHGAGFNDALNRACFEIAAFVPAFLTEDEAWDMACSVVEAQFPGGPDGNDVATIRSGFAQAGWSARLATEEEALNPFGQHCNVELLVAKQGGLRAASPRSGVALASRATVAAADAAVASVVQDMNHMDMEGLPVGGVDEDGSPRPPIGCYLPEEFWAASPFFAHMRNVAWSAMESPEGVLMASLALIAARSMPNVMTGAPVGAPASLNHMFVVCGDPSDGKSVCMKLARKALRFPSDAAGLHSFGPSSGQGIAGQFQRLQKVAGRPASLVRTRWAALAMVDESDTMAALLANKTSTIGADLRKAAMGEELSYGNIGDTQTNIPEHRYRLIFWMCMQPELSDWLLGTAGGGLPQRFLWICVRDPRVVEGVTHPGVWPIKLALEALPDPMDVPRPDHVMPYSDRIRDEIRHAKIERKRNGRAAGEKFDGHAVLNRYKLAGHIALAHGRANHTDWDWDMAAALMEMSRATLGWVREVVAHSGAEEARKVALGRGKSRVIEESVVAAHDESKFKTKCRERVLEILRTQPGILRRAMRERLSPKQQEFFSEVLDELLEARQVRFEERQSSSAWFLQ